VNHQTDAKIISKHFAAAKVDIEVEAREPSLVSISQTYFHNWKAYVDGKSVPLWRANYAFQAVEVPAGRHQLNLVYEDRSFFYGALMSGLALLGCAAGWLLLRKKSS
jgi:uncharacterized membrane protein YfhO